MLLHPEYAAFLAKKAPRSQAVGIEPGDMPAHLFDYQAECVRFALRQGRAAMFLDTGLGKTRIQLEWCAQAAEASNGRALLLTPLAVARQIEREGLALGYPVRVIRSQDEARDGINICNYDRLAALDTVQFGAVSLDESSILKSFTGATTRALIASFSGHRFKLACTATPAPNDHMELGTHAEFLGIMRNVEMLSRWFINDTATASQQWRIKGHAQDAFWDWVASWARCAETPADLGCDASRFVLPPLNLHRHKAAGDLRAPAGMLFASDLSATNMHAIKRQTAEERVLSAREVICGSLNTQKGDVSDIKQTMQSEIGGNLKGARQIKTENTCGNITQRTQRSGIENLLSNETQSISGAASDMPPMRNIGIGSSAPPEKAPPAIPNEPKLKSCERHSGSTLPNTNGYLLTKAADAAYAGENSQHAGASWRSITATDLGKSEASFARTAIAASDFSGITQTHFDGPRPTLSSLRPWVLWVDTDYEQEAAEKAFGMMAVSIRGSHTPNQKEALLDEWMNDARPVLICKPSMFGMGLNFQRCSDMIFVGRSFSYEAWYQAVRRCWRFGQTRPVDVHLIVAEGEDQIGRVIDRKADDHRTMKRAMAAAMARSRAVQVATRIPYEPTHIGRLPAWMCAA
jgi:hypothetical protein